MNDGTHLLSALDHGDPHAANRLLPLVYDELRKLAAQRMARKQFGRTLPPTGLVHEAYFRQGPAAWSATCFARPYERFLSGSSWRIVPSKGLPRCRSAPFTPVSQLGWRLPVPSLMLRRCVFRAFRLDANLRKCVRPERATSIALSALVDVISAPHATQ
jgi:hypothetical protein